MGIVLILSGQALQQELVGASRSECGVGEVSNSTSIHCRQGSNSTHWEKVGQPMDFTYTLILYLSVGVATLLVLVVGLRPTYKRLEVENRAKQVLSRLEEQEGTTPSSSIASLPKESIRSQGSEQGSAFKMATHEKSKPYQTSTQL